MKTAETPAGIFTINKVKIPSAYTCAAEQKIEYISENHMQIITMDQAVSFGDQILSPRICQSCMNPEKITIYPLEIEYFGEKVFFMDHYSVKEWKKGDPLPEIHEWYPHIKNPDAIHAGTVEDVKLHICALNENMLKTRI